MTKRTRPRAEILEYKRLMTAAGGSGASGGGGSGFHRGEKLTCKISHVQPGGYSVLVSKHNIVGFLPTEQSFKPGEEVPVQYVCTSNGRMLFQCRYGSKT
jgi:hypothetical protein